MWSEVHPRGQGHQEATGGAPSWSLSERACPLGGTVHRPWPHLPARQTGVNKRPLSREHVSSWNPRQLLCSEEAHLLSSGEGGSSERGTRQGSQDSGSGSGQRWGSVTLRDSGDPGVLTTACSWAPVWRSRGRSGGQQLRSRRSPRA